MTREEAIRELKADYCGNRIICELYPDQCNREDCEIWLAIKALAEQPIRVLETQPDGDAVSRKDAIRIVDSIDTWQAGWRGNAIESLKALPSAQPEPIKITINAPTQDELERLKQAMRNTPVVLLPSAQHDLCDGCDRYGVSCVGEGCGKLEMPEIIRCKDCKYCDRGIDEDGNPFLKCLGWVYGGTQEKDFCSHAERRTDGTEQP